MPGNGDYLRLSFSLDVLIKEELPDLDGCFIPIKEGHVAVHQDEAIPEWIVLLKALFDALHSLLPIVSELGSFFSVLQLEDEKEPRDYISVEPLIIYHQDFSLLRASWVRLLSLGKSIHAHMRNGDFLLDFDVQSLESVYFLGD